MKKFNNKPTDPQMPFLAFVGHGIPFLTDQRPTHTMRGFFTHSKRKTVILSPHNLSKDNFVVYYSNEKFEWESFECEKEQKIQSRANHSIKTITKIESVLENFGFPIEFNDLNDVDHGSAIVLIDTIQDQYPIILRTPRNLEPEKLIEHLLKSDYNVICTGNIIHNLEFINKEATQEQDYIFKLFRDVCIQSAFDGINEKAEIAIKASQEFCHGNNLDHFEHFYACLKMNLNLISYFPFGFESSGVCADSFIWQGYKND